MSCWLTRIIDWQQITGAATQPSSSAAQQLHLFANNAGIKLLSNVSGLSSRKMCLNRVSVEESGASRRWSVNAKAKVHWIIMGSWIPGKGFTWNPFWKENTLWLGLA